MSALSDSEEEEEFFVLTNFGNQLSENELQTSNNIQILGIDQEQPIAEVNGNIFKGTHDLAMGTYLFAAKDTEPQPAVQSIFEKPCNEKYCYFGKTWKVINFERIYVDEKTSGNPVEGQQGSSQNETDLRTELSYEDAKQLLRKSSS